MVQISTVDTILKTILIESQETLYPPDLIEREPKPDLDFALGRIKKIYTVCGLRRIGKTYYLYQIRRELLKHGIPRENTFYINMEDERIPRNTKVLTRLIPVIKETFDIRGEIYLLIDEIHRIPNWSMWARRIHDSQRAVLFLSGSSSKLSSRNIPRELRGRNYTIRLLPLSFRDFLKFRGVKVNLKYVEYSEEERTLLRKYLREYLEYGGLPEIVLAPKHKRRIIVQEYFRTILHRDIVEQFNIKNIFALEDLLKIIITSSEISISKLYNTLKSIGHSIGKETVSRYLKYAENIFFVDLVTIYSKTVKDRLMYPKKVYKADNAFITSIATSYSYGQLLENLFYIELKRRTLDNPTISIHYWRKAGKGEVDFVVVKNLKPIKLFQVCWDPTEEDTKKREVKGLINAGKELGLKYGIIITFDYENEEKINNFKIKYIPIWKILLMDTAIIFN